MKKENRMAVEPLNKLFWHMGLPMIISMVLQALYNVVDSIFVANIEGSGALANEALTYAFPIQILIIAIGVGTGVGLNAILSKSLGEKNEEKVNQIAGNGIFLALVIYLVFLLFGLFGSRWFISLFTKNNDVINMGATYLMICSVFSLGSIGFTIYERFLQATGKTLYSTIAQISGAVVNVVLDYVFIFPLNMGVSGASVATVIGQFVSMFIAMIFHYTLNKEINGNIKYIKANIGIIKSIYSIGISAAIMQGLLSVMMAGMNKILSLANCESVVLVGAFGIYYKIGQIALFSCFGLSNTIITILSFNYGMKNKERSKDCIKWGIVDSIIVMVVMTVIFQIVAKPLSELFALSSSSTPELISVCEMAVKIASLGYIFMGFSVAVQGVLQALRYAFKPLFTAFLRLIAFVLPVAYLFTLTDGVMENVWWTFPIAEVLTSIISLVILKDVVEKKIDVIENSVTNDNLIITISRQHGTNAKRLGKIISEKFGLNFYDKQLTMLEAMKRSLGSDYVCKAMTEEDGYSIYLSLDSTKEAIIAQKEIITELALNNSCVFIGRCADYILKDFPKKISIFLYADEKYRINKIKEMYSDTTEEAITNIHKSDDARSRYYSLIANKVWGEKDNYDLYINANLSDDEIINIIEDYVKKHNL